MCIFSLASAERVVGNAPKLTRAEREKLGMILATSPTQERGKKDARGFEVCARQVMGI
jgi:hypothetical protein